MRYGQIPSLHPGEIGFSATVCRCNVALKILKVFLNVASEYVLQTASHHPKFPCSQRHDGSALASVDVSKIVIKQQTRITNLFLLAMAWGNKACCNSLFLLLAAWACLKNTKVRKRSSNPPSGTPSGFIRNADGSRSSLL